MDDLRAHPRLIERFGAVPSLADVCDELVLLGDLRIERVRAHGRARPVVCAQLRLHQSDGRLVRDITQYGDDVHRAAAATLAGALIEHDRMLAGGLTAAAAHLLGR